MHGHFRSHDKDGARTIRSAISSCSTQTLRLCVDCVMKPELLPIEVYIARIGIIDGFFAYRRPCCVGIDVIFNCRCGRMEDCVSVSSDADSTAWLSYGKGQHCTRIVRLSTVHAHRHSHTSTVVRNDYLRIMQVFTALHGIQTRSSDEKAVRPSVCLSVKRVHCDRTEERSVQIFIPYERLFSLVF